MTKRVGVECATPQLLTLGKVSKLLNLSGPQLSVGRRKAVKFSRIISRWLRNGELKGFKTRGRWRFYQRDLERILKLETKNEFQAFLVSLFKNQNRLGYHAQLSSNSDITSFQDKGETEDLPSVLLGLAWQYPLGGATPMMLIVALVFLQSIKDGANEIIFENRRKSLQTKYRVLGSLCDVTSAPSPFGELVIFFLKMISDMNLKDQKNGQESKLRLHIDSKQVDFRVKSIPTGIGENIVLARASDKISVGSKSH